MFHRKIKSLQIVGFSLLFVGAVSNLLHAQSNCSRCVSPSSRRTTPQFYAPPGAVANRVRYKLEDTPPVPSPFYSLDANDAVGEVRLPLSGRRVRPALISTQSSVPDSSVESSPKEVPAGSEKPARPDVPATNKPSVAEKQRLNELLAQQLAAEPGEQKQLTAWTTVARVLLNLDETITRE